MRRRLFALKRLFVVVLFFGLCGSAAAAEKLTQIADNVYAYVDTKNSSKDNSFGANAGVIIGRDGIVVVDTLISAFRKGGFNSQGRRLDAAGGGEAGSYGRREFPQRPLSADAAGDVEVCH